MRLLLDKDGKVNYDRIDENTSVKDLLTAVDSFLNSNPVPCSTCAESCCKKAWSVEMDNVCVNRLTNNQKEAAVDFVDEKLVKAKNYYREFDQLVLKKVNNCSFITDSNLCTIYESRPVICRLYICTPKSYRYNAVRELIGSTYLRALVLEDKMRRKEFSLRTISKYKRNPAVFAEDYDILLKDIFDYAEEEGWLYAEDREELYWELEL